MNSSICRSITKSNVFPAIWRQSFISKKCISTRTFPYRTGSIPLIQPCKQRLQTHSLVPLRAFSLTRTVFKEIASTVEGEVKSSEQQEDATPPADGRLLLAFTCNRCGHRQARHLSRRAYYTGVVIIQCDGCKSKHLIADHLDWFRDKGVTVEDLMREKGESVTWLQASDLKDIPNTDGKQQAATEEALVEIPSEDVARLREILGEAQARMRKDANTQATLHQQDKG
ncbi:DNL zinc finger-domain-containing protein [Syncephalis plumigaleata]|nr:DNL zinc finger-domain-containing protein [Syncephalis plumigaleata]